MMIIQRFHKIFILVFFAGIIGTGITSCKKDNDWAVDESYERLFRPTELSAEVNGVYVTLKWRGKPNTGSYTVELSKDSLQFGQIIKTYTGKAVKGADGYSFSIPYRLDDQTRYSARIKGSDTTGTVTESGWAAVTFKSATEQIMYAVTSADMTGKSVVLKWKTPNDVTHFMMGTTRFDITAEEKAAGAKTIAGLNPKTAYTVTLYNNTLIRGTQTFTTPPDLPSGPNVVMVQANDDLAAKLATAVDGNIFVLREGTKYSSDAAVALPANVSLTIWGEVGTQMPIVSLNGITLPASAGTIKFENIDLSGYVNGDATQTKRNYIFNQNAGTTTAGLIFENCKIHNFVNSAIRIQASPAPIVIDRVSFNNCLIYDIGDNAGNGTYSFIHVNSTNTGSKINNIAITNSTVSKIGYSVILHNTSASQSVLLENNTFYNVVGNTRYFIDYNTFSAGSLTIKNNIIGKSLSATGSKGYRGASIPTVINTYVASDGVFASPIPDVMSYPKASAALFTDPDNGVFTIKDGTFDGKSSAGDPRWRP